MTSITNETYSTKLTNWAGSLAKSSMGSPVSIVTMGLGARGRVGVVHHATLQDLQVSDLAKKTEALNDSEFSPNDYVWVGRGGYRAHHRYLLKQNGAGAIWVIDAKSDQAFLEENAASLRNAISEKGITDVPVVVFARNIGSEGAHSIKDISDALDLNSLPAGNQWRLQSSDDPNKEEAYSVALDWLSSAIAGREMLKATTDMMGAN